MDNAKLSKVNAPKKREVKPSQKVCLKFRQTKGNIKNVLVKKHLESYEQNGILEAAYLKGSVAFLR